MAEPLTGELRRQVDDLVERYRDRCLWFLRRDYFPQDTDSVLRTLSYIQRYGDMEAFQRADGLIQWLSRNTSEPSAGS